MNESPRAFISYSHDSPTHERAVLGLSQQLREDEVDAWLDQYEPAPPQGWPRWMEQEIDKADFVLMVCTKIYFERVMMRAATGKGLGALWEGNLIYQHLHDAGTVNSKFIPVLPPNGKVEHIPMPLRGAQRYSPFSEDGYKALYRRLTNQPAVTVPALGKRKKLAPIGATASVSPRAPEKTDLRCVSSPRAAILLPDEKAYAFVPVIESQWDEREAKLLLEPESEAHEAKAFLDSLRGQRRKVFLGYKNNVAIAFARQVQHATSNDRDRWQVTFSLETAEFSNSLEMGTPGLTPDEAATRRAKRILLNEDPRKADGPDWNEVLREIMIAGQGTTMTINESSFPVFFKEPAARTEANLEAAWIFAVLQLKLSSAVEHVTRLELTLRNGFVDVVFSGRRRKVYSNQPAFLMEFTGSCPV